MQMENSAQIYVSKENVKTFSKAKACFKNSKRAFGKELLNVERTPVTRDSCTESVQEPEQNPLKSLFAPESADRDSVLAYSEPIFEHLKSRLAAYALGKDFLAAQPDITSKMRTILVDWLADVSYKFRLLPQTLFAAVNTADRFLAACPLDKARLQLLGVTCLMLHAKIEEVYPPQLKDFVAVCDNAYSPEEIMGMEAEVLNQLDFDVAQPTSLSFLQIVQLKLKIDAKPLAFARYLLETALLDAAAVKHGNLVLAASSVFLVLKIFKLGDWSATHSEMFGVSDAQVKLGARDLYLILQKIDASSLSAVKRKFATLENCEVSKFKIEKAPARQ